MFSPIRRIGALALALTLAACSADQVVAPTQMKAAPSGPDASLLGGLLGTVTGVLNLTTNEAVERTKPLAAPITVTKEIGYYGGTLSIPEAGVTVTVPRGALMRTTTITMTARAGSLLASFGLEALRHEQARNLSYGDQRKLEVALSMAGKPRLLLLDEPMAGLSSAESHSMLALLRKLDPATAVLLIEHDMDIAFGFAEHVTVLAQGCVLAEGHREAIAANAQVQQIYLGSGVE